jgi:hypothetical protein
MQYKSGEMIKKILELDYSHKTWKEKLEVVAEVVALYQDI